MTGLTREDLNRAQTLKPIIDEHIDPIADFFYDKIMDQSNLLDIIQTHSSIERLKKTIKIHIQEMFSGQIDSSFIEKRLRIAQAHVKVGLPTKWYIASFQNLLHAFVDVLNKNIDDRDEMIQAIDVVSKLLNFEQQLVLEAYENEHKRIRQQYEEERKNIGEKVKQTSEELAAISEETSASITELTQQSGNMLTLAEEGTPLARSSEERSHSGKQQLDNQDQSLKNIQDHLSAMNQNSNELENQSKEINQVVEIVQSIADQTNLLALNAAIEAARAGEYGKGFAVVADEIRQLSEQTKESISGITEFQSTDYAGFFFG